MAVRAGLALGVDARSLVLNDGTGLSQGSVRLNREGGDATTAIVGDQEAFSGRIHRQMARALATRRFQVQQGEPARLSVQTEGADGADVFAAQIGVFARCVEEALTRMDRQEAWAWRFHRQLGRSQSARGGVEAGNINAFAFRAGVGAEINQHGTAGRDGFCEHRGLADEAPGNHGPKEVELQRQFHALREHNAQWLSTRKRR